MKNGIASDPTPFIPPEPKAAPKKVTQTQWAKLGKSKQFPDIERYIDTRIEYNRLFLPDGTPIKDEKDDQVILTHYKAAAMVIDELENLKATIINHTKKKPTVKK